MEAAVWASIGLVGVAIGVLATALFSLMSRLDSRFDGLRGEMSETRTELGARIEAGRAESAAQISELRAEMNGRFETVHADIRELRIALRAS